MATAAESISFTSAAPGPFAVKGGRYLFGAAATFGGGTVSLQALLPDAATFATIPDINGNAVALTSAGWKLVDLPPGQYKLAIATATVVRASLSSLPG